MDRSRPEPVDFETGVYPGFPTDLRAQLMALMSVVDGNSQIKENVFENRFMHILELNRMGCDINVKGNCATIEGVSSIYGAEVMATDIRASFSLIIAAMMSKGTTVINRIYHLDRGYEDFDLKLKKCGVNISRKK